MIGFRQTYPDERDSFDTGTCTLEYILHAWDHDDLTTRDAVAIIVSRGPEFLEEHADSWASAPGVIRDLVSDALDI